MRTFILACFFVLTTTIVFSQQKAPLGKLLTKRFAALTDQQQSLALIKFTDKGNTTGYQSLTENSFATERSLQRRKNTRTSSNLITELDYPLERSYVNTVEQHVIRIRHQLKWFNAVSAIATKQQIEELRSMPFVKEIELIGRWKRAIPLENQFNNKPSPSKQDRKSVV